MKEHDLIDFLALAAERGASDLHLTVGAPPMLRVAGVIQPLTEEPLSAEDTRRLVIDTLKEGQRAKLENEWQLDFALQVGDLGRYRGNACYVSGAIEANFRRIPSEVGDLKSLRQDADVILVGELRDTDTMQTAITAAETGHLVIGTMHTNDAPTAIGRIIDAFPKEGQQFVSAQLAWSLLGVVCQYLLPRSGQAGLILATELLTVNSGIEACIRSGRLSQIPGLIQIGAKDGMHTVDDSLIELLLAERISLIDALAHARDPNFVKEEFQKALKTQRKGWFSGIFRK